MRNVDQWNAIAEMLGNLIAKYADVLDIDSISDTNNNSNIIIDESEKIINNNIDKKENI